VNIEELLCWGFGVVLIKDDLGALTLKPTSDSGLHDKRVDEHLIWVEH
jgi:hypothetical protein